MSVCNLQITKNYFLSCDHIKLYIHVLNNFTKKGTRQNMLCFKMDNVLGSKTAKVKIWNHNTKNIQSSVNISVHTIYHIVS